ncbi:MAG: lysoplasmalogenase [Nocardioides sp.]|nr:lysoplasmalogenase [Nocardioides sp.]
MTRKIPLAAYVVIAVVHLGAQVAGSTGLAGVTQALLMPALAVFLITHGLDTRLRKLTLLALTFSWVGDLFPRFLHGDAAFMGMIVAFLCAQVSYIAAFRPYAARSVLRTPRVIPYVVVLLALVAICAPGAGALAPAVVVYGLSLLTMAALATGVNRLTTVGGAVFVVSDSLIALDAFVKHWPLHDPVQPTAVMATYVVAQALLTLGVLRHEGTAGAERQEAEEQVTP